MRRTLPFTLVAALVGAASLGAAWPDAADPQAPVPTPFPTQQTAGARAGQSAPTGMLVGTVMDGVTGQPIPDAVVSLTMPVAGGRGLPGAPGRGPAGPQRVLVDGQGRFVFREVPAGPCSLSATRPGFFGGGSNQRTPLGGARPIELVEAERMGGVTLKLWPFGAIAGSVFDESGTPVTGVSVMLLKRTGVGGEWRLANTDQSALTDDRGAYRFGSVSPGTYALMARSDNLVAERLLISLMMSDEASAVKALPKLVQRGEDSIILDNGVTMVPATYYPGTPAASQAMAIVTAPGETKTNLDLHVRYVRVRSVSGTVTGQDTSSNAGRSVSLRLRPADPASGDFEIPSSSTSAQPSGRFVFIGVPPGDYVIDAIARSRMAPTAPGGDGSITPDAPVLVASAPISVSDHNITDLALSLVPSGGVSGRVDFAGTARPPNDALTRISVTLEPVGVVQNYFGIPRGRVEADGTFSTSSIARGRYLLRVSGLTLPSAGGSGQPAGQTTWRPQSAIVNGRDALDQPVDIEQNAGMTEVLITFTDKPGARLTGTVRDAKSAADPQATILVFPTDSRLWTDFSGASRRIRIARTSRTGAFTVAELPPGEYFVALGTDDDFLERQAPGVLDALSRSATRVSIVEGQPKALDLRSGGR